MNNYNKPFECRHETRQNDTYFNKNCFRVLWFFSLDKIHQETKQKLHPWFHELEKLMVNYNGYGLLMNIFFTICINYINIDLYTAQYLYKQ